MRTLNQCVESFARKHGFTIRDQRFSGAYTVYVRFHESNSEFLIGTIGTEIKTKEGKWIDCGEMATKQILQIQ